MQNDNNDLTSTHALLKMIVFDFEFEFESYICVGQYA